MIDVQRIRRLAPATAVALIVSACAGDAATTPSPETSASPSATPAPTAETSPTASPEATVTDTPEPTVDPQGPAEPGDTAWYDLVLQGRGELTGGGDESDGDFHEGHVLRAGTLDAGLTTRLELPEDHAFADGPRVARVLVGSDDGTASEVLLVNAATGEPETVLSAEQIVWGGTLSPDASAIYYVTVDRAALTDAGLWRLALEPDAEPEQVIEQVTPATYDFASQYEFAWSPDGEHLVAQYCNRRDCVAHVVDVSSGVSRPHDQPGVFELRGATDREYVADAISGEERSGILAVDFETLEVRVVVDEWGVSQVHDTDDGPLLVYFAPDQLPREVALVGVWLDRDEDPFVVYEDRDGDLPLPPEFNPRGTGYEAPEGWTLMWPGSPGPEPQESEPQFTLLDVLSGQELTFPYERPA